MVYTLIRLLGSKKNRNLAPFHDLGLMRFLTSDKRTSDGNMAIIFSATPSDRHHLDLR